MPRGPSTNAAPAVIDMSNKKVVDRIDEKNSAGFSQPLR